MCDLPSFIVAYREADVTEPRRVKLIKEMARATEGCYADSISRIHLAEHNGECVISHLQFA